MAGTAFVNLTRNRARLGQEYVVSTGGTALAAATADGAYIFTNHTDRRLVVFRVVGRITVQGGAGALVTLERVPSGTAVGSGTDIHATSGEINVETGTVNTNLYLTINETEGASGTNIVEPGESLYVETAGTLTGLAGLVLTVYLREIQPLKGV